MKDSKNPRLRSKLALLALGSALTLTANGPGRGVPRDAQGHPLASQRPAHVDPYGRLLIDGNS